MLDIIDLYLYFKLFLNKISLDLNLNPIVVLKEISFDNEQVTIISCVKIIIFITIGYMIDEIRWSGKSRGLPILGHR